MSCKLLWMVPHPALSTRTLVPKKAQSNQTRNICWRYVPLKAPQCILKRKVHSTSKMKKSTVPVTGSEKQFKRFPQLLSHLQVSMLPSPIFTDTPKRGWHLDIYCTWKGVVKLEDSRWAATLIMCSDRRWATLPVPKKCIIFPQSCGQGCSISLFFFFPPQHGSPRLNVKKFASERQHAVYARPSRRIQRHVHLACSISVHKKQGGAKIVSLNCCEQRFSSTTRTKPTCTKVA